MSDLPHELDLKFLPDWLKEEPSKNRYADFEGESDRPGFDSGQRRPRGDRRDDRKDRGGRTGQPPQRRDGPGPRNDRGSDRPRGKDGKRPPARDQQRYAPRPEPVEPAPLKVEFVPEPNALTAIAKQIRQSGRAYPFLGTARLFLEQPERYRVRLTAIEPEKVLFQIGDGPISFDRAAVERDVFRTLKDQYYRENVEQGEPPKGNFTNVARVKATGALIGPTNHHAYQPALRRIYEERYARRMSFAEFQQREIQVVNDEQMVNDWKEQARSTVTYETIQEAEPITFKNAAEAEAHFRTTYLPGLVKSGATLEASGPVCLANRDAAQHATLAAAWNAERGFPSSLMNRMRPAFLEAGLHFVKHRKRVLFVSPVRPVRHESKGAVSEGIATILKIVEEHPRCSRHDLAVKVLGENIEAPEVAERKSALAADLHYLVHAGHVIEFADRTLDLPLLAKPQADSAEKSPVDGKAEGVEETIAASNREAEVEAGNAVEPPPSSSPVVDEPCDSDTTDTTDTKMEVETEPGAEANDAPPSSNSETTSEAAYPLFVPPPDVSPQSPDADAPDALDSEPPASESSESQPPP
ncbi:MAG: hypothetical protein ABI680_07580 [Chthoniobacteraceae bacterium]